MLWDESVYNDTFLLKVEAYFAKVCVRGLLCHRPQKVVYLCHPMKLKLLTIAVLVAISGMSLTAHGKSNEAPLTAAKEAYEAAVRFYLKGEYQNAIASYMIAGHLEPDHPAIFNQLGRVYFERGEIDKAQAMFEKSLTLDSLYPDAHFMLGKVYKEQKEYQKAIEQMDKYLELPTNADDRVEAESIKAECEKLLMPQ